MLRSSGNGRSTSSQCVTSQVWIPVKCLISLLSLELKMLGTTASTWHNSVVPQIHCENPFIVIIIFPMKSSNHIYTNHFKPGLLVNHDHKTLYFVSLFDMIIIIVLGVKSPLLSVLVDPWWSLDPTLRSVAVKPLDTVPSCAPAHC